MKKNIGIADKIVRLIIAAVAAGLYFGGVITGTLGIIILVAGGVMLMTGLISFCPLYAIIGLSSCGKCCGKSECDTSSSDDK